MFTKCIAPLVALTALAASGCLAGAPQTDQESEEGSPGTAAESVVTTAQLLSPLVFDWGFYVASNPNLVAAGINTKAEAESHWIAYGAAEGRQAHRGFHSKQYFDAYPDVVAWCGSATNYPCAIEHFVAHGESENRLGAPFDRSVFNWTWYLDNNPDLRPAGLTTETSAKAHWVANGINEGRQAM